MGAEIISSASMNNEINFGAIMDDSKLRNRYKKLPKFEQRALDALMYQEVSKSDLLICRAMGETGWSKTDTSKFMDMYFTNEQNENVNTCRVTILEKKSNRWN